MTTVTFTDFRQNLSHFLNKVDDDCEEVVITRSKGRKAVLLSLSEYSSIMETAYLMSSSKNRRNLRKSLKQAREGKTVLVDLAL